MIKQNKKFNIFKDWKLFTFLLCFLFGIIIMAVFSGLAFAQTGTTRIQIGPLDLIAFLCKITFYIRRIAIILAIIGIIVAGLLFVTAGGNEEKLKTAKNALKWVVLGTMIIFGAYLFIQIVAELFGPGGGCPNP